MDFLNLTILREGKRDEKSDYHSLKLAKILDALFFVLLANIKLIYIIDII